MRSGRPYQKATGISTAQETSSGHTWSQSRPLSDPVTQVRARAASSIFALVSR